MNRHGVRAAVLAVVCPLLALQAAPAPAVAAEAGSIRYYAATGVLSRNGMLHVDVEVQFDGAGGAGPVIPLPLRDDADDAGRDGSQRQLDVTNLTLRSSSGAPADTQVERDASQLTIKVAPGAHISGEQHYVLSYDVAGTYAAQAPAGQTVRWPVLAANHRDTIRGVTATLRGPTALRSLYCSAGKAACSGALNQDSAMAEFEQPELPAKSGLRVGVTAEPGAFVGVEPAATVPRGNDTAPVAVGLVLLVALGVGGFMLWRRYRPVPTPLQQKDGDDQAAT